MSNPTSVPELCPRPGAAASPEIRPALASVDAMRALLDALGVALLLVDDGGRPIFVNRRAAQILAQHDGLANGSNGLATDCTRTTRSLRTAIAAAAACAHSPHARSLTLRFPIPRRSSQPPWLLSILPIAPRDALVGGTAGYAAISIAECDAHTRIDPLSAASFFLLTPRETDVAALLAAGRNSREAARALHIGIGTVRTHLKSLFDKTGARSQTALALKLQAFAIRD